LVFKADYDKIELQNIVMTSFKWHHHHYVTEKRQQNNVTIFFWLRQWMSVIHYILKIRQDHNKHCSAKLLHTYCLKHL